MNERIKELADQAELTVRTGRGNTYMSHPEFNKKFAELIVRQMLDITDAHTEVFRSDRDKALVEHIKQSVKTHFGVEK